jgi:hypothetical protein
MEGEDICPLGEVRHLPASAICPLSVADVRTALFALRHAWFERMTPEGPPFLLSDPAIGSLSMAAFGCMFDYGQHVKRHQRLVRGAGARQRGARPKEEEEEGKGGAEAGRPS